MRYMVIAIDPEDLGERPVEDDGLLREEIEDLISAEVVVTRIVEVGEVDLEAGLNVEQLDLIRPRGVRTQLIDVSAPPRPSAARHAHRRG